MAYNDRDTGIIPDIKFSFVEEYIKTNKFSSGQKSINKGFKYYSESYIHSLKGEKHILIVTTMFFSYTFRLYLPPTYAALQIVNND